MASVIRRYIVGSIYYGIGLALAYLAIFGVLLQAITKGRKGIVGLFKRGKHDIEPEIARRDFEHDYVRTRSGIKFHYVHAGDEDNPLMLCLHGFPECWYSWKYILKKFSTDYHVVAFDLRGYGDSDKPKSISQYHITHLINDVPEIIEALGYQQAVLVGHDWGGVIVWQVPLYFPECVSKIIVMNSPNATGMREFVKKNLSQVLRSWYMFFFQIPIIPEFAIGFNDYGHLSDHFQGRLGKMGLQNSSNFLTDEEVEIYKYAAMRNLRYAINYYRAINPIYQGLKIRPVTRQIVQPTLLIWGSEDQALDVNMVPYCLKGVKNSKRVIIKGASHCVGLDEPEKVNAAIEEFFDEYND